MVSAWGTSWGAAWGNAWGTTTSPPVPPPPPPATEWDGTTVLTGAPGRTLTRKRYEEIRRELEAAHAAANKLPSRKQRRAALSAVMAAETVFQEASDLRVQEVAAWLEQIAALFAFLGPAVAAATVLEQSAIALGQIKAMQLRMAEIQDEEEAVMLLLMT